MSLDSIQQQITLFEKRIIKPFRQLKKTEQYKRLSLLTNLFNALCGEDNRTNLFESFLSFKTMSQLDQKQKKLLKSHHKLIENIRVLHEQAPIQQKCVYLSITHGALTFNELMQHGFKINSRSFANANKHAHNVGMGAPVRTTTPQ